MQKLVTSNHTQMLPQNAIMGVGAGANNIYAAAQTQRPHLPDWMFEPPNYNLGGSGVIFSLIGQLYARVAPRATVGHGGYFKFSMGKVGVINAVPCGDTLENQNYVSVFVLHDGKSMLLEDDANLFPSDSLVTKLIVLSGK
jgi:hypothetical protein